MPQLIQSLSQCEIALPKLEAIQEESTNESR